MLFRAVEGGRVMRDCRELEGWYAAEAEFLSGEIRERRIDAAAPGRPAGGLQGAPAKDLPRKVSPGETTGNAAVTAVS